MIPSIRPSLDAHPKEIAMKHIEVSQSQEGQRPLIPSSQSLSGASALSLLPGEILRPAEWVFPGHPDRLADEVARRLVLEAQKREARALCGVEVAVHRDRVYLTGRIACEGSDQIDFLGTVQEVYRQAGYGNRWKPAPEDLKVGGNICTDTLLPGESEIREMSDDQGITIGYANHWDAIGNIPPEQWLVRELANEIYALVRSPLELCPDGKVLLVLGEREGAMRLLSVSASLLAPDFVSGIELQREVVRRFGVCS